MLGTNIHQDVLHARRPTLNYVSPAICEAVFSGSSFATLILEQQIFDLLTHVTGPRFLRWDETTGTWQLEWDVYPDAICYNIYTMTSPGVYTLVAECVGDPNYNPNDPTGGPGGGGGTPGTPGNPTTGINPGVPGTPGYPGGSVVVTAVTPGGETPFPPTPPTTPPGPSGPPAPTTYYNVEYTATCPDGSTGSPVTIPADTYSSIISQADADGQAQFAAESALSCTPDCDIVGWDTLNWTTATFFESPPDSHSAGTISGNTITFAMDGTPSTSSGGFDAVGTLVYTGPTTSSKVIITGGPFPADELMSFTLRIESDIDGILLNIDREDVTTSPQEFPFSIPTSVGANITVSTPGANYTQNPPGVIAGSITILDECICPDWDTLLWDSPNIVGGSSFSPANTTGNAFFLSVDDQIAQSYNTATIEYNGPGCECNLNLTVGSNTLNEVPLCSVTVAQITPGYTSLLCVGGAAPIGVGVYDIPFTLPDTLGVPQTFQVQVGVTHGAPSYAVTLTGVITNVA